MAAPTPNQEHVRIWRDMVAGSFHPTEWWTRDGCGSDELREATFMWVYKRTPAGTFEVGYYNPDREWVPDEAVRPYGTPQEAAERVRWLHGQPGPSLEMKRAVEQGFRGDRGPREAV